MSEVNPIYGIVNSMVIYFQKNPDFQKKKNSHKKFREILAHELVQPLLDKRAEGEHVVPGPGRKSVSQICAWKENIFQLGLRKKVVALLVVTKRKEMESRRIQKLTTIFARNVISTFAMIALRFSIRKARYSLFILENFIVFHYFYKARMIPSSNFLRKLRAFVFNNVIVHLTLLFWVFFRNIYSQKMTIKRLLGKVLKKMTTHFVSNK